MLSAKEIEMNNDEGERIALHGSEETTESWIETCSRNMRFQSLNNVTNLLHALKKVPRKSFSIFHPETGC